MLASAATAAAGLGTFVVAGAWLDDEFDVHVATSGHEAIEVLLKEEG